MSTSHSLDSPSPNSLYLTLQYWQTIDGENKYHWALYLTENSPPAGFLLHAIDTGRIAMDLYKEILPVHNPLRSKIMVVVLRIATSISLPVLEAYASSVPLMDPWYLPLGEVRWTCRVWVEEILKLLQNAGVIALPCDIHSFRERCLELANSCLPSLGLKPAKIFNDETWASSSAADNEQLDHPI